MPLTQQQAQQAGQIAQGMAAAQTMLTDVQDAATYLAGINPPPTGVGGGAPLPPGLSLSVSVPGYDTLTYNGPVISIANLQVLIAAFQAFANAEIASGNSWLQANG